MLKSTPRERFISYVRSCGRTRPVVSPFLPYPGVIQSTLKYLDLPVSDDDVENEIRLAAELDYEPMFMTEMASLIFPWKFDASQSSENEEVSRIPTKFGDWIRRFPKGETSWNDSAVCPVRTEKDHDFLVSVCENVDAQESNIRTYFRVFRQRVGEQGVIVVGHPHPGWLGYQISPESIFYHWMDYQEKYLRSMEAIKEAALFVMSIAIEEGLDFMSDSSYGLEMTSPRLFAEMDLPHIQSFSKWTHDHGGLFWYHNCGYTSGLIRDGSFNALGADVIETIAPPPEGDNDLRESRTHIDRSICSKGNLNLTFLRDARPEQIVAETRRIIEAVDGYSHIYSTADAVLSGTPPENFVAFVATAREYSSE